MPLVEKLVAADPGNAEYQRAAARTNQRLGTDHVWLGENAEAAGNAADAAAFYAAALPFHLRMKELIEAAGVLMADGPEKRQMEFTGLSGLAETLGKNRMTAEAMVQAEQVMALAEKTMRSDPANREGAFDLALAHDIFGRIYTYSDTPEKAASHFHRAITICNDVHRADPNNSEAVSRRLELSNRLTLLNQKLKNPELAERSARRQ